MTVTESESVRVARRFTASPQAVFQAWIDAALLQRWLAPVAQSDPRVGGHFRLEVPKAEGSHVVSGEYRELVPGQRLVATWIYEGPMTPEGRMEALLTVGFRPDGPDTEIDLCHEHLTNANYREVIRQGAWTKAFDQLEAILAGSSKQA